MGALVTPPAVAVIAAEPTIGLPELSVPLQTIKAESHSPAQSEPSPLTVTLLGFEELKVNVGRGDGAAPLAFKAATVSNVTWPATSETDAGPSTTWATTLLFLLDEELLPQPARKAVVERTIPAFTTQARMPPPRPHCQG